MTRPRNNRNRNRNSRNQRGNRGGRLANKPRRVARSNNQQATRKFRAVSQLYFQQSESSTNGTYGAFAYTFPLSSYTGYQFVEDNFEQYKVTNVEVLMKPSLTTINNGEAPANTQESILFQNSIYSAMNGTYVRSFIDYDTGTAPTIQECETRTNLKVRALVPNNWTKIASFCPRSLSNQGFTGGTPSNTFQNHWMSTNNMGTQLFGVRGVASNSSPIFDTQDNVMAIEIRLTITVQMKGPKNATPASTTIVLPSVYTPPPLPRTEPSAEERETGDGRSNESNDQEKDDIPPIYPSIELGEGGVPSLVQLRI